MICSFCGKSNNEVGILIVGLGHGICDECVALCNERIVERKRQWALEDLYALAFRELWQGA